MMPRAPQRPTGDDRAERDRASAAPEVPSFTLPPCPPAPIVYADANSTLPQAPEVTAAVAAWSGCANASNSHHTGGLAAHAAVEACRAHMASWLRVPPASLTFCSGATEANTTLLRGLALKLAEGGAPRVIAVSDVEHASVLETARALEAEDGFRVIRIPCDATGVVGVPQLRAALERAPRPLVVAIMHANNETGAVNPIADLARYVRGELRSYFMVDAAQSLGRLPDVHPAALYADALTFSAHKFGGPKGVGVMFSQDPGLWRPLLRGGPQEGGRRAGTENVAGIVGATLALDSALRNRAARTEALAARSRALWSSLMSAMTVAGLPAPKLLGPPIEASGARLPNTLLIATGAACNAKLLAHMNTHAGVAASVGSACGTSSHSASHVLLAMGVPREDRRGVIRISLSDRTTDAEVDVIVRAIVAGVAAQAADS